MRTVVEHVAGSALVLCASLYTISSPAAQTPVGALAVDERQGDQYGWAVDYKTAGAAGSATMGECGAGCSVVLTFARCAAYALDQDADSTAVGPAAAVRGPKHVVTKGATPVLTPAEARRLLGAIDAGTRSRACATGRSSRSCSTASRG